MTAIRKRHSAGGGGDILGIHSVNHFVMAVPDLHAAESFHTAFGLNVRDHRAGYAVQTDGSDHNWGFFVDGPRKRLQHLSFGVFEEDFHRFKLHLEARGIELLAPPRGFESNGLWFRDHDGNLIELVVTAKTSPDSKMHGGHVSTPPGIVGAPLRSQAATVRPTRLAHILIFTRDVQKAIDYYTGILGMGLSDRSGDTIAFMHGRHGSDHHMLAFAKSPAPGLHHTSWDVPLIDQVGQGAAQMADKGFSRGWGLGRHVLGSNFFHYIRDPWGSYAEYSCDIDYIPADMDWRAKDHAAEDSFYMWGPTPPEDFATNYEAD